MTARRDVLAWVDASAGVAGDMLLAALIDAGAELTAVQAAVDAVIPDAVRLEVARVSRGGMRALKVDVAVLAAHPEHRNWRKVRARLAASTLVPGQAAALRVFGRLAAAEAHVHGIPIEDVHFHEVGALDSIADIVGVCAALDNLGVSGLSVGSIAVGSGRIQSEHGDMPVPVPAVLELTRGWTVRSGGTGELATPTGVAVLTALASQRELPELLVASVGIGAGSRDPVDRANVVRVVIGEPSSAPNAEAAVHLECNIDDLDPRLWPAVIDVLLANGAADAWLAPILMKKGRPAHTLHVLCAPDRAAQLREVVFDHTSTIGLRQRAVDKFVLPRAAVEVQLHGATVQIKVAHRDGRIVNAMPEFEDVAAIARESGVAVGAVLADASAAAWSAGLVAGARWDPV